MSLDAEWKGEAKRRCNICGRIFKNDRGVRIHQVQSKCKEQLQQRKASNSTQKFISEFISSTCQSEEDQSQEANHSTLDLRAETAQSTRRQGEPERLENFERKSRLNLPASADHIWVQLDEDLSITLAWITS